MNDDERAFLELVSLIKKGNKAGRISKSEGTANKLKRDPKIKSKVILKLYKHQEYDKVEIQYKVSWRDEASAFMLNSYDERKGKMLFGSMNYIVGELMDYLHPTIQEELVYSMNKF